MIRGLFSFQGGPEFLQGPFFDAGDVAAADAGALRHLPLALGRLAPKAVAQLNDLPLLIRQTGPHRLPQGRYGLFCADLFQQVRVVADHIHQRQRRPIRPGLNVVRQRHIIPALPLGPEMHEDLICYPPPNAFLMH